MGEPLMIRNLSVGCTGPDVQQMQMALNYRARAGLDPDSRFGEHTRSAVISFQERYGLQVDGIVGSQTRHALFPLVGLTLHAAGAFGGGNYTSFRPTGSRRELSRPLLAMAGNAWPVSDPPPIAPNQSPLDQFLRLLPGRDPSAGPLDTFRRPGCDVSLPIPPILTAPLLSIPGMQLDSRQLQPGVQFNTKPFWQSKSGSANPSGSLVLALQSVLALNKDAPGHVEVAEGFQLGGPFTARTSDGKDWTFQWFAQATWVDPFWQKGNWHLVQPFAQISAQVDLKQGTPTLGLGLFPVNISVELVKDKLSLFGQGGAVTNWDVVGQRVEIGGQAIVGANITLAGW
jgi:Putative peptidoglycan binding domain